MNTERTHGRASSAAPRAGRPARVVRCTPPASASLTGVLHRIGDARDGGSEAHRDLVALVGFLAEAADAAEARLDRLTVLDGPEPGLITAYERTTRGVIAAIRTALGAEPAPIAGYHAAVQAARAELDALRSDGAR